MTTLEQLQQAIAHEDALAVQLATASNDATIERLDVLLDSAMQWTRALKRQYAREQRRAAK